MAVSRRIAVLTGSRSDYGLLYWTIRRIHEDPDLELILLVTGTHLSPEFGLTVREIVDDGLPIAARIECLSSSDTGEGVATSMGLGTIKIAQALAYHKTDLLVVLGDRTEVLATAAAALPLLIPIAHIHGGESTEGVIDEGVRHAVTKLSHLHFTATEFYARRLLQMGEEEWRVNVCGAPGLEHLYRTSLPTKEEVERELELDLANPTLLVTHHALTLSPDNTASEVAEVLAAVEQSGMPAVITYPGADAGGRSIIQQIENFQARKPQVRILVNLGSRLYLGLLRSVVAMVGNSSSGIIEAASLGTPAVNVGERQRGRLRTGAVIDVPADRAAILEGIRQACEPAFRRKIANLPNPYDRGNASETIVRILKEVELGPRLLQKRLVDQPLTVAGLLEGERVSGAAR